MRRHGPWTIAQTTRIYQDPWICVDRDDVIRPDGLAGTYSTVQLKPGITVIAVDDREIVYLTQEFHYAVGRVTLEGVSGGIEVGETPRDAAARELLEELGIIAQSWTHLGTVDPFTSAINSPVELYLAQDLSFTDRQLEGTELIESISLGFAEAVQGVMDGQITHAPTCVALLKIWLQRLSRAT